MAADSVRGDGLFQAHAALAELAENPEAFDQARERRFSKSPPSNRSESLARSGTTTRSPSPEDEDQAQYDARYIELHDHWMASVPYEQFQVQLNEEARRINPIFPDYNDSNGVARASVRERWIEQGIWDSKWEEDNPPEHGIQRILPTGQASWKHELPLREEPDSEDDSPPDFSFGPKRKRQRTAKEERWSAHRRVERQHQREASRPIHQFNYQVSQERDRLLKEEFHETDDPGDSLKRSPPDVNTRAYAIVKDKWVKTGLWVDQWGILPGMTWLHERNWDELVQEELGASPSAQKALASSVATSVPAPAPAERLLFPLVQGNFGPSPATQKAPASSVAASAPAPAPAASASLPSSTSIDFMAKTEATNHIAEQAISGAKGQLPIDNRTDSAQAGFLVDTRTED